MFGGKLGRFHLGFFKLGDAPATQVEVPFIPSQTVVYSVDFQLDVPFIGTVTSVKPLIAQGDLVVPIIHTRTVVYTPIVQPNFIAVPFLSSHTVLYEVTFQGNNVVVPFLSSSTVLYELSFEGQTRNLSVPLLVAPTTLYSPVVQGDTLLVPFISSTTALYTPVTQGTDLPVPFRSSTTAVYTPVVQPDYFVVPFIASRTALYPPYVQPDYTEVPFIASATSVRGVISVWRERTGPGNGGELSLIQLAPTGVEASVNLASSISSGQDYMYFDSPIAGQVDDIGFVVTIDSEVIHVRRISSDGLFATSCLRGVSNTTASSHTAGADATWNDTYEMECASQATIPSVIHQDATTYTSWLVVFDSSQAYIGASRYPTFVDQLTGVYAGPGTTSKIDAPQPSATHVDARRSDDCPCAITNPALVIEDINVGDVALLRYVNTESEVLVVGSRAASVQSWYGLKRVSDTNTDVPDRPTGHVIDGTTDVEVDSDDFLTAELPGAERVFTYGPPRFNRKGWPFGALAVRQGTKRIPLWTSPDWHNFGYVYTGFDVDATYVQIVIDRNGVIYHGVEPSVELPGPQNIFGPNVTWDDTGYETSATWYVAIFGDLEGNGILFTGPPLNTPPPPFPPPAILPGVGGGGGGGPGVILPPPVILPPEGGSGGDIDPTGETAFGVFVSGLVTAE